MRGRGARPRWTMRCNPASRMRALFVVALLGSTASAQVTIDATTNPVPAPDNRYTPRNVVVVWVEDAAGTFVKTVSRRAGVRAPHLVAWIAQAGAGDSDAVTGATRLDHATPLSISWDLKDRSGTVVPDGTYTIRMELAEENSTTAGQNNQGTFTLVKSASPQMQTALSNGGFSNVSIAFSPLVGPPPPSGSDAGVDESGPSEIDGGCSAGPSASLFTVLVWMLAARRRRYRARPRTRRP